MGPQARTARRREADPCLWLHVSGRATLSQEDTAMGAGVLGALTGDGQALSLEQKLRSALTGARPGCTGV